MGCKIKYILYYMIIEYLCVDHPAHINYFLILYFIINYLEYDVDFNNITISFCYYWIFIFFQPSFILLIKSGL